MSHACRYRTPSRERRRPQGWRGRCPLHNQPTVTTQQPPCSNDEPLAWIHRCESGRRGGEVVGLVVGWWRGRLGRESRFGLVGGGVLGLLTVWWHGSAPGMTRSISSRTACAQQSWGRVRSRVVAVRKSRFQGQSRGRCRMRRRAERVIRPGKVMRRRRKVLATTGPLMPRPS